jgi:hypothetical protein
MSYTEFEFQVASDAGLVRLIFLVGEDSDGPATYFHDPIFGARQDRFRKRLRDSGLTVARVTSPGELEAALLHALLALPRPPGQSPTSPVAIRCAMLLRPIHQHICQQPIVTSIDSAEHSFLPPAA